MKIASKIAEKILSYCSKCGGCPMSKIMDAQLEIGGKDSTPAKKTLRREAQSQVHSLTCSVENAQCSNVNLKERWR